MLTDDNSWIRNSINISELNDLQRWAQWHDAVCPSPGDDYVIAQSYKSGIGVTTIIRHIDCGATNNVTDYAAW